MPHPTVQYTITTDGLEIAYQVLGEGPVDVIVVPGLFSNLDLNGSYPFYGGYVRRIPSFARAIFLDRRGAGVSDRGLGSGSAEDRMEDVRAVMDAVGSKRVALLGQADGGAIAMLFAATYPERVSSLVLVGATARIAWAPDYEHGLPREGMTAMEATFLKEWGSGAVAAAVTADAPDRDAALESLAILERSVGTPRSAVRQMRLSYELDVRSALSLIEAPTLVIHGPQPQPFSEELVRHTAEQIPGARYVRLPSLSITWDVAKQDVCLDVIEEFLTGYSPMRADTDRVLATVLFTDIVDSTERAAQIGDQRWRATLDAHDARCALETERFRGRVVKHTGDGMLALFDGPARAIRCAHAVIAAARSLGLEVRAGVHTGEVEQRGDDVSGVAVHIAARILSLARAAEVLASGTVRDLVVGSGLEFEERGEHELRGMAGRWRLLSALTPGHSPRSRADRGQ